MKKGCIHLLCVIVGLFILCANASAQFRTEAFSQGSTSEDGTEIVDTTTLFSFSEYFGGLKHERETRIGTLFAGSTVFIGGQQIYNKQYWKLPVIYGGIGASVGMGLHYRNQYKGSLNTETPNLKAKSLMNTMFVSAGLVYWGSLLDGVVNYNKDVYPQPGKAALYSALLPGLGQVYNGEYWKVPVYWGCLIGAFHFLDNNNLNYKRFKSIYNEAAGENKDEYTGHISAETAKYYRDSYRRYRDYSILAVGLFYLLQIIDANVFAYMQDFEVNDELTMSISPTIISPDSQYALNTTPGVGMSIGLRF